MQNKNEPIIGLVDTAGGPINFYSEKYCTTLMSVDKSEKRLDGEFVLGRTLQGRDIAFYKGKTPIIFSGAQRLNTPAYIISTNTMKITDKSTFDSIEFRGGTLNKRLYQ